MWKPAIAIEVGSRIEADMAVYPDDDLCWFRKDDDSVVAAHKDGSPY